MKKIISALLILGLIFGGGTAVNADINQSAHNAKLDPGGGGH